MTYEIFTYPRSPEGIIQHNLTMLKEDMPLLLGQESLGGNAGFVEVDGKKYSCAGANGLVNKETGEIVAFGNIQDKNMQEISETTRSASTRFVMRVAFAFERGGFFKIVDTLFDDKMSTQGQDNLQKAVEQYNLEKGSIFIEGLSGDKK